MTLNHSATIMVFASAIDYLLGDPWGWLHPVQVMGWVISGYTQLALKLDNSLHILGAFGVPRDTELALPRICSPKIQRLAGVVLTIVLIGGSALVGWLIIAAARWVHPILYIVVESILLASCFAGRSLRAAADSAIQPLAVGDLDRTRQQLSLYVGRDTENLSESEILRALLETVTENAVDGVTAPLFFAIVGAIIPVGGIAPFALAYKAASTLDSMVGYKEAPYTDLGMFSAKLEDLLTWLPCRLTVITLCLLSGKPGYVWRICQRDGLLDPSPNAGWSECAYAAILGVQLGGLNYYRGVAKYKPLLADPIHPITTEKVYEAMQLTRYCFLIWLGLAIGLILLTGDWGLVSV